MASNLDSYVNREIFLIYNLTQFFFKLKTLFFNIQIRYGVCHHGWWKKFYRKDAKDYYFNDRPSHIQFCNSNLNVFCKITGHIKRFWSDHQPHHWWQSWASFQFQPGSRAGSAWSSHHQRRQCVNIMNLVIMLVFILVTLLTWNILTHRVLVGEVDNEIDSRLNLAEIKAEPLPSITHWANQSQEYKTFLKSSLVSFLC